MLPIYNKIALRPSTSIWPLESRVDTIRPLHHFSNLYLFKNYVLVQIDNLQTDVPFVA